MLVEIGLPTFSAVMHYAIMSFQRCVSFCSNDIINMFIKLSILFWFFHVVPLFVCCFIILFYPSGVCPLFLLFIWACAAWNKRIDWLIDWYQMFYCLQEVLYGLDCLRAILLESRLRFTCDVNLYTTLWIWSFRVVFCHSSLLLPSYCRRTAPTELHSVCIRGVV